MSSVSPRPPSARDLELAALFDEVNNAGRWGADDELGTLNHITPAKRAAAAALVREGRVVSLAHPITAERAAKGRLELEMIYGRPPEHIGVPKNSNDRLTIEPHASALTHVDSVSHMASNDGRVYNGRDFEAVAQEDGLTHGSVFAQRGGIVSRGVLLDLPAARGVDWLDPAIAISAADLEEAESREGVRVGTGDVLVLRGGTARRRAAITWDGLSPGPAPDAIRWVHQREIAAYAGDMPDHVGPRGARILGFGGDVPPPDPAAFSRFEFPLHQVGIAGMGLVLFDHCAVEELADACRELGRYEFLFVAAPLPLRGASGSAINPLAIF